MKALKRWLCTFLALLLIFGSVSIGATAAGTEDVIIGSVKISGPFGSDWQEQTYYYSDDYFRTSGKEVNEHLVTMSALSTFYLRNRADDPATAFSTILKHIGFSDIVAEELDVMTADSIGTLIGRKTVDGVPVIAVMIRGDDYESEWAANFLAGVSGDITGFSDAADKVVERIGAYLLSRGIKHAKYWVSGYSRSGAVANLVGRTLNENLDAFATTANDIYVYTYEAPRCTDSPAAFENIHNFIDSNDPIPAVYPAVWPAERNGVDLEIGDTNATIMSKRFALTDPYLQDFRETNLSAFVSELTELLGEKIDRQTYAEILEEPVSDFAEMFFSLSQEDRTALMEFAQTVGKEIQNDPCLISTAVQVLFDTTSETTANSIVKLVTDNIDAVVKRDGKPIGDEDFEKITALIRPLVQTLMPVIDADKLTEFDDGETAIFYHLCTAIANAGDIIAYHFNYNVFERLKMLDSYYSRRDVAILGDADGNGIANVVDATVIQRYLAELDEMDAVSQKLSDVDADGDVSCIDATWIQRYDLGMNAPDAIGKPV